MLVLRVSLRNMLGHARRPLERLWDTSLSTSGCQGNFGTTWLCQQCHNWGLFTWTMSRALHVDLLYDYFVMVVTQWCSYLAVTRTMRNWRGSQPCVGTPSADEHTICIVVWPVWSLRTENVMI
jgi:hypothetical protein